MGGAERGEAKRKQQAASARALAQARGGNDKKKVVAVVIGVVLLAAAVVTGVLLTNSSKNQTAEQTIAPQTGSSLAAGVVESRDGVAVLSGKAGAKTTIDVYADFLCPICGQFQQKFGPQIEEQVNAGKLQVRYHMLPLLNQRSDPPGYSLDSANASLCAADEGKFTPFHDSLFASQPQEGTRGYSKDQLVNLGKGVGITGDKFAGCVTSGTYDQQINSDFDKVSNDPNLQQDQGGQKGFGTPTVASGGKVVQLTEGWLDQLLAGNQG